MSTQSPLSPQPDPPPAAVLLPLSAPPPLATAVEAAATGGARKLSHWEEMEEVWFPEETDFTHSGINE